MLLTDGFVINILIIFLSIILAYIIYIYLNNDLIDINKLVINDIEKFTDTDIINADIFIDETIYPKLESYTTTIENQKNNFIDNTIISDINKLKTYIRK